MYRVLDLILFLSIFHFAAAQDFKWKKYEVEADTLMNRQEFEEAIKLYSKAISSSKLKDRSAYPLTYKRAVCYYSIGQFEDALQDIATFQTEYKNVYQAHLLKAFIYREMDNTDEQLKSLEDALSIQPGDPGLIKWRSSLYLHSGDYENAKSDLEYVKAIQDDPEVEMYLGFVYYNLEQLDSAFHALNKAIELDPTFLPAYLYAGSFSLQEENNELALKYLNVALRLDPSNVNAQFYKGVALVELEQMEEGCRFLAKAFYSGEDDAGGYLQERCYTLVK